MRLALVCNIDRRGRSARYRIGFVLLALGVAAYALGSRFVSNPWPALLAGPLVLGGSFSLFEANRGWCAVRALGFKTKL